MITYRCDFCGEEGTIHGIILPNKDTSDEFRLYEYDLCENCIRKLCQHTRKELMKYEGSDKETRGRFAGVFKF